MTDRPVTARRLGARCALAAASVAALFAASAATAAPAQAVPAPSDDGAGVLALDSSKRIEGSYIVVLNDDPSGDGPSVASTAQVLTGEHGGEVTRVYSSALNGFAVRTDEESARELAADPAVDYVEANQEVHALGTQDNPPSWGLDRVDQDQLPLDNSYTYPDTSDGVTAYIIDTGVRVSHNDFGGRATWGVNTTGDGRRVDCNGHGTHVAGTTAGERYGLAKEADLVAVKVLGCDGSGSVAGVVDGIDWVTQDASGPSVANMSLGGGASTALDDAIRRSIASGITYAVAAGNADEDACNGSPSRVAEAITVGSTTRNDSRSYFSNWGTCLDIFAPGSQITSAWNGSDSDSNTISGTSMASPHVAGAAALVTGAHPSWTPRQVRDYLVENATRGVVSDPGRGSPNRLLRVVNEGGNPQPDPDNDFSLATNPSSGSVEAGAATGTKVTTSVTKGDAETVALSASGLPSGVEASFDPASVTAGGSSGLTLDTSASTPSGTYEVTITGTSDSAEHSTTFTLTVTGGGDGGCEPGQKLTNPGFESGSTGWQATSYVIDEWSGQGQPAHSGSWSAWLNGRGYSHTDRLSQQVSLPAGCSSYELTFWLHIDTDEFSYTSAYDTLTVQVLNQDGTQVLDTLKTYSNLDAGSGYTQRTLDLSAHAGEEIRIRFLGEEDVAYQTSFVIDDTAVNVS